MRLFYHSFKHPGLMFVLALDQGTTSSRAILFDPAGRAVATRQQEFAQHFPKPGWVEHDAEEIWRTQLAVARDVLSEEGVSAEAVAAIGITNQRETTVIWDRRTGRPIGPAIVWQDRRTADRCAALKTAGHEDFVSDRTGLLLDPYFSGTKAAWLLDHVDGARQRADRGELAFGTIDSWLIYRLTGGEVHATDPSNASRTLLFDIHDGAWSADLCAMLDVPMETLPEVRASSGSFGHTEPGLFGRPIPISGVAGDQQAALFGQVCTEPGMVKNTYGTGCFALMQTGATPIHSKHRLLTTVAWDLGEGLRYALEGSVFVAGAAVQWLRDGLGLLESAPDIEPLAASVPDTDDVYLVPAFTGLGAPHWDPYARGILVGITRGTTAAHVARATLESLAFQSADLIGAMESDSGISLKQVRVDGGAASNDLLMQIQADVIQADVIRPDVLETTALGAAYLAGLHVGYWDSVESISELWRLDRMFSPELPVTHAAARRRRWRQAVERSLGWAPTNEAQP